MMLKYEYDKNRVITKYIREYFEPLIQKYGFTVTGIDQRVPFYCIQFSSSVFELELTQSYSEVLAAVYKGNKVDKPKLVDIFVLLDYLHAGKITPNSFKVNEQDTASLDNVFDYLYRENKDPNSNFYLEEKKFEARIERQLDVISNQIYRNFDEICSFFDDNSYNSNMLEFDEYCRSKYPEKYKDAP